MKRWHLSGYVFLAVVAALLLSVAVGAQDKLVTEVTCEGANASRDAGLYGDALEAYAELLKNDTYRDCALAGIRDLQDAQAKKHYELGQTYEEAKQYDLAHDEYKKALEINSSYNEAPTALDRVSIDQTINESNEALARLKDDLIAEVRALADRGFYAAATERLKKVVEENPDINVPGDLEYLLGEKIAFWKMPGLRHLGELVLILVIMILVVWRIWNLRKPRLDIEDFDKGATGLEIGKGLAAMVEVSFKQIGESGAHGSRPSLIEGTIEKFEIPADVKSVHPYVKIVSALFEWLFRPNVYILSGYLQKPEDALGAGLTLSLVRKKKGEIIANETIWQKDFDPAITPQEARVAKEAKETKDPAPYYRLAEPAAIWTLFQEESVRDKLSWWSRIKRCFKPKLFKKKFALLGTRDWLSFAYFRAGVRWAREELDDKARKLYVEALNQDTDNRGARFNLGALDTEAGEYGRAIDRLEMAREKYLFSWDNIPRDDSGDSSPRDDSGRLRRCLVDDFGIDWAENAEIRKPAGNQIVRIFKDKNSAEIKLDESEEKAILKISDGRTPELKVEMAYLYLFSIDADAEFEEELNNSGTPSEELKKEFEKNGFSLPDNAAVKIEEEKKKWLITSEKEFIIEKEKGKLNIYKKENKLYKLYKQFLKEPVWYKATYQLASAYSYQGNQQRAVKEAKSLVRTIQKTINAQQKDEDKALRNFLKSFEPMAVIMYAGILVGNNKEEEAKKQIESINSSELSYRGHYNMACYYSSVGKKKTGDEQIEAYDHALRHLKYALERGGEIVQWAQKDESLKGVRGDRKVKFYALIRNDP